MEPYRNSNRLKSKSSKSDQLWSFGRRPEIAKSGRKWGSLAGVLWSLVSNSEGEEKERERESRWFWGEREMCLGSLTWAFLWNNTLTHQY